MEGTIYFDICRSALKFEAAVADLVHEYKYKRRMKVAGWLAEVMVEYVQGQKAYQSFDYIMAVPLHRVRKRERGFNQSELVARALARKLGTDYIEPVIRAYYTKSQTMLSKAERQSNLSSAFTLKKKSPVTGKRILIVDDVFTTGSTVNEISKVLKTKDPEFVAVLTAARA
ncbi:MAG: ComF family protein [Candidatus Cloacimonetes bacterium]|nr:ComF family protein [Candidatus Cloacimonadota bacterium]